MRKIVGSLALFLVVYLVAAIPMGAAAYYTPTNWIHQGVTVGWINFWVVQAMVGGMLFGAAILIIMFAVIIKWMQDR